MPDNLLFMALLNPSDTHEIMISDANPIINPIDAHRLSSPSISSKMKGGTSSNRTGRIYCRVMDSPIRLSKITNPSHSAVY